MKKFISIRMLALMFTVSLLASCGGGGSNTSGGGDTIGGAAPTGDTMTVSIWSLSTATTTTTYSGDQYDPVMTAQTSTTTNKTYIDMGSGYNIYTSSWAKQLALTIGGTSVGTYTFSSPTGSTGILYTDVPKMYQGRTGSITITSMGNVGSRVTGTFAATVGCASSCTGTAGMSGSFNVTRIQ